MASTNFEIAIAKKINFPSNAEWYDGYEEKIESIVETYIDADEPQRDVFKDDLSSFVEVYNISGLSDDDLDYIQPYFCYIDNQDLIQAISKVQGSEFSKARKIIIREIFKNSGKSSDDYSLTDIKEFEDIDGAWNDVSTASLGKGIKMAYKEGKINLQWKQLIDSLKPKAITWEALDFAIDVLSGMR